MFSAKQGNYWYHFYNVFGMTQSLTGDWTRDLPHSKPALYHQAIEEAVNVYWYIQAQTVYVLTSRQNQRLLFTAKVTHVYSKPLI